VQGDHRFYHAAIDGHRCQSVTPSDLGTVLSALDASVTVRGAVKSRTVRVDEFFTGPGETVLQTGEFVSSITIPSEARGHGAHYEKLNRGTGDFAVVSVATQIGVSAAGAISSARVVLGAMAPVPFRARDTEAALIGQTHAAIAGAAAAWVHHAHPLPGNAWKIDAAVAMVRRSLDESYRRAMASQTDGHTEGVGR